MLDGFDDCRCFLGVLSFHLFLGEAVVKDAHLKHPLKRTKLLIDFASPPSKGSRPGGYSNGMGRDGRNGIRCYICGGPCPFRFQIHSHPVEKDATPPSLILHRSCLLRFRLGDHLTSIILSCGVLAKEKFCDIKPAAFRLVTVRHSEAAHMLMMRRFWSEHRLR